MSLFIATVKNTVAILKKQLCYFFRMNNIFLHYELNYYKIGFLRSL